jgi:hypothetical protein
MAIPVAASIQIAIREWWDWRRERVDAAAASDPAPKPGSPEAKPSGKLPPGAVPAS